jgi:hypothetical protein
MVNPRSDIRDEIGISRPLSASPNHLAPRALTMSPTNRSRMMRGLHRDIRYLPDLYSSRPRQPDGCLSHLAASLLVRGGWPSRSGPTRLGRELDPGRHAQLGEDVGEMGLHCSSGDEQAPADLDAGESLTHQPYHLELGGSEAFPSPRGSPTSPSSASADA